MYGCWDIGQRAGFASSGRPNAGRFSLWHRRVAWLSILRLRSGVFLLLLLCLPWGILVTVATDGEFLANAIKSDFLAKVAASQESHGAPPGIYALLLGLLIWPASPLLVWAFTNVKTFAASTETRFLLAWIFHSGS